MIKVFYALTTRPRRHIKLCYLINRIPTHITRILTVTKRLCLLPARFFFSKMFTIYWSRPTKIDDFVCPINSSETVAVRIVKLAHRPPIASTAITVHFINCINRNSGNRRWPEARYPKHRPDKRGYILVLPPGRSICITLCSLLICMGR